MSGGYYVTVIEDKRLGKIIGAATLTVEQKFIHNCSLVCVYFGHMLCSLLDFTHPLLCVDLRIRAIDKSMSYVILCQIYIQIRFCLQ